MTDDLHLLEQQSIHVVREAYSRLKPLVMLWSIGKDSNTLLWLVRKAFLGRIPFPVALLDTGNEFPEVYALRDRMVREWGLDCINVASARRRARHCRARRIASVCTRRRAAFPSLVPDCDRVAAARVDGR